MTCHGCGVTIPLSHGPRARKWCTDRCRKQTLYSGTCIDCGKSTNGYDGPGTAAERCRTCLETYTKKLIHASILTAIREWADEHGGIPPAATDWNPALARQHGYLERAEAYEAANGRWPALGTVQNHFGSWNAAIEAAGFEPRKVGHYGRDGEDPEVIAETARLYAEGVTWNDMAERLGVTTTCITWRLRKAGVQVNRPPGRRPVLKEAA